MCEHFTIRQPRKVGFYVLHGLKIELLSKPRWLHCFMMRWAFGWKWEDA